MQIECIVRYYLSIELKNLTGEQKKLKTFSNDIFIQTRSVLNELRQAGCGYEDSIMSIVVLLFIIDNHKIIWEEPEGILLNDGYDFFQNLEFRANDLEDDSYYDTILSNLKKLEPYQDIVIRSRLVHYYFDIDGVTKTKLLDQLIDDLSKNSRGLFAQITNESINSVFSKVVSVDQYARILDPCIGSGKLIVGLYKKGILDPKSVTIVGIENDRDMALLAYINLSFNGFKNISINNADALEYSILEDSYDIIVSDLPMGVILKQKSEFTQGIPSSLRFYFLLIQKCRRALTDEGKMYISANSSLVKRFRSLSGRNEDFSILAELIDVSEIANWSYTSVKPYIIVLDKEMPYLKAEITLVKLNREGEKNHLNIIDRDEFDFFSHIEDLGFFFSESFDRIYSLGTEGFDALSVFFKNVKRIKIPKSLNDDSNKLINNTLDKAIIKDTSGFRILSNESELGSSLASINSKYMKYIVEPGDWILVYDQKEVKVIVSEVLCLVAFSCVVIRPKFEFNQLERDWLIAQLRSEFIRAQLVALMNEYRVGIFPSSLKLDKIFIDRHSIKEKKDYVSKWKESRIELLEEEKKRVESKYSDVKKRNVEEQVDLIHDLHHTLKNELSIITGAAKSIKAYLENKSDSNESVSLDDPVRELRVGADPKLQKKVGERLTALLNASHGMTNYLNEYKSILRFDPNRQNPEWIELKTYFKSIFSEYSDFSFTVIEKFDQLKTKKNNPWFLKFDKTVFRLVLSNVISNAMKYGFTETDIQYSFQIEIEEVPFNKSKVLEQYPHLELPEKFLKVIIKNDGNSLPEKIKEEDFFRKGFTHGADTGSGIGTYHIKKGIESMGGLVGLSKPKEDDLYKFQLVFFFPYPIFKTKSQLKDEGELL